MNRKSGVYTAVATPYDKQFKPDPEQFITLLNHLKNKGSHGVLIAGTTGEGPSLNVNERRKLFKAAADNRNGLRLLAGTGAASLEDVIELTKSVYDYGLDCAVIVPPFFFKNAQDDGLFYFFTEVIQAAVPEDGSVYLYHNPVTAPVGLSLELVQRLRDAFPRQIVGIKDSSQDWEHTRWLITELPDFEVFVGDDRLLSLTLEAGGMGSITLATNLFISKARQVYDLIEAGEEPADVQNDLNTCHALFNGLPRIPVVKHVLKERGIIHNSQVRPPLLPLSDEEQAVVEERFFS